ncbi:hypothetical protein AAFF_G00329600 [Aldrovandia affinis]|uniref:Uncharacterized protein n=1 Tax=Aldrovandia affinis TaxID=143900 RepID=A0AAD7SLT4_9TELE|nr:hypothetical protein AAFF_G00329600 [Aldrovandia affinis]
MRPGDETTKGKQPTSGVQFRGAPLPVSILVPVNQSTGGESGSRRAPPHLCAHESGAPGGQSIAPTDLCGGSCQSAASPRIPLELIVPAVAGGGLRSEPPASADGVRLSIIVTNY